jgi:hypothetical protein
MSPEPPVNNRVVIEALLLNGESLAFEKVA